MNSEIDMFRWMYITSEEDYDPAEIFDGLILLHIEPYLTCFTKVKPSKSRKNALLAFANDGNVLQLGACPPDEFDSGNGKSEFDRMIREKHGVNDLLIEKKQLGMEWESADNGNKRRISKRLRQLNDEIKDYGVYFVDGKATLRDPML